MKNFLFHGIVNWRILNNSSLISLIICQVAAMSIMTVVLSTGVSIASNMFASQAMLTLPITAQILGTFFFLYPASFLSGRYGRKLTFITGALIGVVGSFLGFVAIIQNNFWLFCFAMILIGFQNATAQYFRFAAMEVTEKKDHASAISLVLLGGVLAAFIGPSLSVYTKSIFITPFLGVSLALFGLCFIQLIMLFVFYKAEIKNKDDSKDSDDSTSEDSGFNNSIITAIIAGALGFGIMTIIMNATPIASQFDYNMEFHHSAEIIKWHILFMYLPSFFTGKLIDKFGFHTICLLGCFFYILSASVAIINTEMMGFVVSLIFLGIGWNLTYISSSYYIGQNSSSKSKSVIQGTNDTIIFAVNSCFSFGSAFFLAHLGWINLNLSMFVLTGLVIISVAYNLLLIKRNSLSPKKV